MKLDLFSGPFTERKEQNEPKHSFQVNTSLLFLSFSFFNNSNDNDNDDDNDDDDDDDTDLKRVAQKANMK